MQDAAQRRNGTLFAALVADFALLLRDASGDQEVVFGTSVVGRNQDATARMLGVFVNPLPMRITAGPDQDMNTVFDTVRDGLADLLKHQDYSLIQLTQEVKAFEGLGLNDVFDAHIVFQNYPAPDLTAPRRYTVIDPQDENRGELWGEALGEPQIMRPLELVVFDREDGSISLNLGYKPALFEVRIVRTWMDDFMARLAYFSE